MGTEFAVAIGVQLLRYRRAVVAVLMCVALGPERRVVAETMRRSFEGVKGVLASGMGASSGWTAMSCSRYCRQCRQEG